MEPVQGSTAPTSGEKLPSSFRQYRFKNLSAENDGLSSSSVGGVDSGYVSSNYITPNNTPVTQNAVSSIINTPNRFTGSEHLVTIEENRELNESMKLTPVTQNIRKISDFHITTPKSNEVLAAGCKRNSAGLIDFGILESTPKKSKYVQDWAQGNVDEFSISKIDKFKSKNRKFPFKQKLKSAPDLDSYFRRNNENIFGPKKADLSPIFDKNAIRERRTPLANATNNILQSSTPKSCGYRPNYYTGQAKYKPSSVKKLLAFTDNQFDSLLKSGKAETVTSKDNSLLAKDSFEFYEQEIEDIYKENVKDDKNKEACKLLDLFPRDKKGEDGTPNDSLQCNMLLDVVLPTEVQKSEETDSKNNEDNLLNDTLERDTSELPDYSEIQQTRESAHPNFDIKSKTDLSLNVDILCEEDSKELGSLIVERCFTPPPMKYDERCVTPSPIEQDDAVLKSTLELSKKLQKTPTKAKRLSLNHERLEILYPTLPRTPSKYLKPQRAYLKRSMSEENKPLSSKTSLKQARDRCKKKFYNGITHLNIIAKLESYTIVLEKILGMLSSQDLANMAKVSRSWRRIVRANHYANLRRLDYIRKRKNTKENVGGWRVLLKAQSTSKSKNIPERKPFCESNIRSDRKRVHEVEKSPPVSPSKRKFYENQKVVRTLETNEKLVKCPRCGKSSLIINTPSKERTNLHHTFVTTSSCINNNDNNNNSDVPNVANTSKILPSKSRASMACFGKNRNFHSFDYCTPMTTSSPLKRRIRFAKSKSVDTAFLPTLYKDRIFSDGRQEARPYYPYAECTGITCKFKFCLDCLCEYHPGTNCKLSAPISPSKEDVQNGILQLDSPYSSTHRSGKVLRRKSLKRLCF